MDITDPEILRAERFGSRENWKGGDSFCLFCGKRILLEENCVLDIAGNLFCQNECRERSFDTRKKENLK